MYKKTLLFASILLFSLWGWGQAQKICIQDGNGTCIKSFFSVKSMHEFLDQELQLSKLTIKDQIPFDFFKEQLNTSCEAKDLQKGELVFQSLKNPWSQISSSKKNAELTERFELLLGMIAGLKSEENSSYCLQRNLLLSLLELTQEQYLGKASTNKASIIPNSSKNKLNETQQQTITNTQTTTQEQTTHSAAPEQSPEELEVRFLEHLLNKDRAQLIAEKHYPLLIINNKQNLKGQDKIFALAAEALVQSEIAQMISKGIFDRSDLKTLDQKIELNYVSQCGNVKGKFHLLRKIDGTDKKVKKIDLNINLCYDKSYLNNFGLYVRQLTAHELGHYLYFFKDQKSQIFDQLCWDVAGKNSCQNPDFVSDYAQEKKEEDYAESFSYRYMGYEKQLEHGSAPSQIRTVKYRYFDQIFGK